MASDKPSAFPFTLLPAVLGSPILSSYLRRHQTGTMLTRALIVAAFAALATLLSIGIARLGGRQQPSRTRFTPVIIAIVMALASIGSDFITTRFG